MDILSFSDRFDECPLSPLTLKGVKAAGYERMTAVQEATLPIILQGSFPSSLCLALIYLLYDMNFVSASILMFTDYAKESMNISNLVFPNNTTATFLISCLFRFQIYVSAFSISLEILFINCTSYPCSLHLL